MKQWRTTVTESSFFFMMIYYQSQSRIHRSTITTVARPQLTGSEEPFRSHPRGLVYAAANSLVLIGRMWTTCNPSLTPPPLHPPFVSKSLTRATKGARVEGGGVAVGHLLPPVLRPNSPTALIHHICQRQLSHLTGHPSLERTPLSEPQSQRCPPSQQWSLGGGGGVTKERR